MRAAVRDADAQVPAGVWLRLCVSNVNTIYADLQGREPASIASPWAQSHRKQLGEGLWIEVSLPRELTGKEVSA